VATDHSSIVPGLRREIQERIDELDLEKATLRRVLRALDSGNCRSPIASSRAVGAKYRRRLILNTICTDPGIRATMLALVHGTTPERVIQDLRALEDAGYVRPDGLGWVADHSAT
jgi:hypothetical protein